jgi:hypothetical protein
MQNKQLSTKDLVWVWIRNQEPDLGIVIDVLEPEEWIDSHQPTVLVSVGDRLFRINKHRIWSSAEEAILAGPPFFLPNDIKEMSNDSKLAFKPIRSR